MPRKQMEFNLEIDESVNEIFDENVGNSFLAMRRLRWSPTTEFKLDLRKWYTNSEGEEIAGKGFSFITEEGPNELAKVLIKHGYGNTEDVMDQLSIRDDFIPSVNKVLQRKGLSINGYESVDKVQEDAGFYDPKELF